MTNRIALCCVLSLTAVSACAGFGVQAAQRPNILWIVVDDMSANFSC